MCIFSYYHLPNRLNYRKRSVEECIFGYMALHIGCQYNQNSLLQRYFLTTRETASTYFRSSVLCILAGTDRQIQVHHLSRNTVHCVNRGLGYSDQFLRKKKGNNVRLSLWCIVFNNSGFNLLSSNVGQLFDSFV